MNANTTKRFVGELVELSRDCELGQEGDRAVVTALVGGHYMALTFPDRAPDCRVVHTGADYEHLRAHEGAVEWSIAELVSAARELPGVDRDASLRELRALVATYLEGSDDADRAQELLDALDALDPNKPIAILAQAPLTEAQKDHQRRMFGLTTDQLDDVFQGKSARDVAMYAMGTLSNAQEMIRRDEYEGEIEYSVSDANANSIRQFINIAKYAIDKAVPR